MSGEALPVVATCSQELFDGQCPEGALTWIQLPRPQLDLFAMPSAEKLLAFGHDLAIALALPTFVCVIVALAMVYIHDTIS